MSRCKKISFTLVPRRHTHTQKQQRLQTCTLIHTIRTFLHFYTQPKISSLLSTCTAEEQWTTPHFLTAFVWSRVRTSGEILRWLWAPPLPLQSDRESGNDMRGNLLVTLRRLAVRLRKMFHWVSVTPVTRLQWGECDLQLIHLHYRHSLHSRLYLHQLDRLCIMMAYHCGLYIQAPNLIQWTVTNVTVMRTNEASLTPWLQQTFDWTSFTGGDSLSLRK